MVGVTRVNQIKIPTSKMQKQKIRMQIVLNKQFNKHNQFHTKKELPHY